MKKLLEKPAVPVYWTLLILILLCLPGSSIPDIDGPYIPHFDKIVHFILFGGFSLLWNNYLVLRKYPAVKLKKGFLLVLLAGISYGILMEIIQFRFIPDRSFDTGDIVADAAGSLTVWAYSIFKLLRINSGNE